MNRAALALCLTGAVVAGCVDDDPNAPPEVVYGSSVCDFCNMIISDARFATATIVLDERGPTARLFDDFNCQFGHESAHPSASIVGRWAHDYTTREWLPSADAHFVRADSLRTPMASHVAAFADGDAAERVAREWEGEALTFDQMRSSFAPAAQP